MQRLKPHGLQPSPTDEDIVVTRDGVAQWASSRSLPFLALLTATNPSGDFVDVWSAEGDHIYVEVTP